MKLILFLFYLLSLLPIRILHYLARIIGYFSYHLAKKRRHIAETNIALCFPEKTSVQQTKIIRQNFYHAACMLLEYSLCWYASPKRIKKLVSIQNQEIIQQYYNEKHNIIILYPHFYALELAALRLNLEYPLISVFTGQKNKRINEQIYRGRNRFNSINPVHLIRRNEKIVSIIHLIKKSAALFLYLPDQDFGEKESIFVPFFNIPTATTTGVSRIAKITHSKIIPAIPIRQKNGTIILEIFPALETIPSDDVIQDTSKINFFIENIVKQYPEQYFWLHKRFKTRPKGENSVY